MLWVMMSAMFFLVVFFAIASRSHKKHRKNRRTPRE
jgi:hypothetical protein